MVVTRSTMRSRCRPRALVCRADGFGGCRGGVRAWSGAGEEAELGAVDAGGATAWARRRPLLTGEVVEVEEITAGLEPPAAVAPLVGFDQAGADEHRDGAVGGVLGDTEFGRDDTDRCDRGASVVGSLD